jgi:hypothetical protein
VLVFPPGESAAFTCYTNYLNAGVPTPDEADCDWSDVTMLLNVESYGEALQTLQGNDMQQMHIVIDNSRLPPGGAMPQADLTTMLSIRTTFYMNYNIKTLTIYAGLLIIALAFATAGVMYIYCKTRSDFTAKQRKLRTESDGQFGL